MLTGLGIIPAYAGSTTIPTSTRSTAWDHPRIRGEHEVPLVCDATREGSSPHTRGALLLRHSALVYPRIIPAYAGSTSGNDVRELEPRGSSPHTRGARRPVPCRRWRFRDHPRIRGEHGHRFPYAQCTPGSSPHTRGALECRTEAIDNSRIIPAYAGSTCTSTRRSAGSTDHPRIRGEHERGNQGCRDQDGSSPHTRGAPPGHAHRDSAGRIIPAYAGST